MPATTNMYNAANQLTQFGAVANIFDGDGNLAHVGAATYTGSLRQCLNSIVTSTARQQPFLMIFAGNLLAQADSGPSMNLMKKPLYLTI